MSKGRIEVIDITMVLILIIMMIIALIINQTKERRESRWSGFGSAAVKRPTAGVR